ncbi:hypothetical protein KA183_01245 [bacterium]|nr:hypothetical protein [bacterium]
MASSTAPSSGAESEPNDKEIKAAGSVDPLESTDTTVTSSKDVVEKFIQEVLRPNIPSTAATAGSDQVANQIKDIVNPPANPRADQSGLKPDTKAALNLQLFIRQLVTDKGLKGAADLLKGMSPADRAKLGGWDIQVNGTSENPTFAIKKDGADITSVRGSDIQIGDGPINMSQLAGRTAERFDLLAQNPKFLKAALTGLTALLDKERQPGGSLADPAAFNAFISAFNTRMGPGKMELSATDKGLTLKKVPGVTGDVTSDYSAARTNAGDISSGDTSRLRNYLKASQSRISDLAVLAAQPGVDPLQLSEKFSAVLRGEFARTGLDPAKLVDSINAGMPPAGADGTKYAARFDATKGQIVFEKVDSTGKALQVLRRVSPENLPAIDLKTAPADVIAKRMAASSAEVMGVMTDSQRDVQLARANQWLKGKPELAQQFFTNLNQELTSRPETAALKTKLKPADAAAGTGPEVSIEKAATTAGPSIDILDVPIPKVTGDVSDPIKQAIQQLDAAVPNMKRFTDAITDPTKLTGFKAGDSILRIAPNGQDRIIAVISAVDTNGKPTELSVQIPAPAGQQGPPQIIKVPFEQFVAQTNGLGDKSAFVGYRPKAADAPGTTDVPVPAAPVDLAKIMGPEAFANLTDPQKQNLAVLFDGNASHDAKLKAAEALWTSGMRNFQINDNNDKKRTITLQKSGIMMHVFAQDDRGRTTIALRGVKRGDTYQQQVDKRGRPVSFVGSHFLKNGGENSVLNGKASDAPTQPSDKPVAATNLIKPNDYAAFQASMSRIFATSDPTNFANRSVVNDFSNFVKASETSQDAPEVKAKAQQEALLAAVRAEAALYPKASPQEIATKFKTALGDQAAKFNLDALNADVLSPAKYFAELVKGAKTPGEVARLFTNFTRIENARNPAASADELKTRLNDALTTSGTGYSVDLNKFGTEDNNLLLYRKNQAGAQELVSRIDPRHIQIPGQQENVLQLAGRLVEPLAALQGEELKSYWQQVTSTMKELDSAKRELLIKSLQAELAKRPESKHLTITPNADSLSLNSNREGKTEAVAQARFDAVVATDTTAQPVVPSGAADLKKILGDQQLAGKTPEQLAALQAFFKPGAKPEEQLAAARALALANIKSLKIQDGDKSRTLSFQLEKAGKRSKDSYVHVYATDDRGKSRIAIRGISDDKGVIRQQGRANYYGDIWTKQIGNKSILSGGTAPVGPAAPQEVPKPVNQLSPLFKADQIKWDATAPVEPANPAIIPSEVVPSPATVTGAPFDAALTAKSLLDAGLDGRFFTAGNKDDYDRIKGLFFNRTQDELTQLQAEFLKQSKGVRLEAALVKRFGDNTSESLELRRLAEGDNARLARIAGDLQQLTNGTGSKSNWEVEKDLRDTFATMTNEQIVKFHADFLEKYKKSLSHAISEATRMSNPTRSMLQILTDKEKGSDKRTAGDTILMSQVALDAGNLDMFKEVWRRASSEARQRFMAEGGEKKIYDKWGSYFGTTQQQREALDYVKDGTSSVTTEVVGNTGGFGDTEAAIEAGIDKMTAQQRADYFAGKALAAKVSSGQPEPTDAKEKAQYDYYKQLNSALYTATKNAFWRNIGVFDFNIGYFTQNSRELQAYEDRIKFGKTGSFVSDVIIKDGYAAKSEDQILTAVDTMTKERWEHAKANRAAVEADLRSMLERTLTGTFGGADTAAVNRVMDAFKRKMDAGDYQAAQALGRTLAERMDAKKGGFLGWGADRGGMLEAIAKMDQNFITRYKSDEAFRLAADKSLSDGTLKGAELVAAKRMLERVLTEGKPNPDVLDKLIMFKASGTSIKDMVVELDKLFREDPQAFAKFQALSGTVEGNDLQSLKQNYLRALERDLGFADYLTYLAPMLERGKPIEAGRRMEMYMGMFGNDMEGVTKAILLGGPDLWNQIKSKPDMLATWNPLYKFNTEQADFIQKLAENQASLPKEQQGTIPPEFKIRLAILNGKGDQIKQETDAISPQNRGAVTALYNKTFGRVLTDDLIKSKIPEGQTAAVNFAGALTLEQATDVTRDLVYGNMGGRWWTSLFDATASQVQDRVDQLVVASTEVAVTKMDLPPDQRQELVDRALQTYVNYKASEHSAVDAGADAAFAVVGVVTFVPALAGAIETGGVSLYAWGAGMAALGAVMRPGVKAALLGGQYDWRANLLKDATVGAIEMPTYVLGPGLLLRAGKAFVEPSLAAVRAMRLAGNPELAQLTANRFGSVAKMAPDLVRTAGDDIASRAIARVTTDFKGLTAEGLTRAIGETTEQAATKAVSEVLTNISNQLKTAGLKPFTNDSIKLASERYSQEVVDQVLKEVVAGLAKQPGASVQALVKESLERAIAQLSKSEAFSAEAILRGLASAEVDAAAQQGITQLMRQGFARAQDIPEKDILAVAMKITGNNPAQAALLAQAIKAQIPHTAAMTSKNVMDAFIKTYPNLARSLAHTAPASFAGLTSGAARYEWDPSLTFEQNMARMGSQAAMGAFIAMAMVGTFTVPTAALKAWRGKFNGTGVARADVREIALNVEPKILGKLEDGRPVKLTEGGSVRVASNAGVESQGVLSVAAQNVDSTLVMNQGKTFLKSTGEVPPQVFRNNKWETLAPDELLELQHGQMIKFGPEGKPMVFMRAVENGTETGYLLAVPELSPKLLKRMVPEVVNEAGFQPGARLRITPGRNVVTIGGEGADVIVGSLKPAGLPHLDGKFMVEASMPEPTSMFQRWIKRNADDLARKGEVNIRNTGDHPVSIIRKTADGIETTTLHTLKALQDEATLKGLPKPTEVPKFRVRPGDEVVFPATGEKFKAYSQNGAIRLERLANEGSEIPVIRNGVATVLRANADDLGRVERAANVLRNRGSDASEYVRAAYTKVADQIRSGELIDRLRNGYTLGRVLRNNDFEKAATMTDVKLASLGFGRIDPPAGFKGTLYRNYQTGVEILREGDRVVQVTANGRTLKINWSGDKVASFVMPDGEIRTVIPHGGNYKAPSLRELPELAAGYTRLYRATFSPSDVDLARSLTAREVRRLERLTAKVNESGLESLPKRQATEYQRLLAIEKAGRTREYYTSIEEAVAAANLLRKADGNEHPTIFVQDLPNGKDNKRVFSSPYEMRTLAASRAVQHPQSFTNNLNDGSWMISLAEASAVSHYGAQITRDVGFRINASGFTFLRGFSDAGMLARARAIIDQATSRITRGVASRVGFSHLIHFGERIDLGTAFGSELLSKNPYVKGRAASLSKTASGLRIHAGEGDIVVLRNGVPVVLKEGQAILQTGDRVIVGKFVGNGLYKGDEFVVGLDGANSAVLQHTRSANRFGYLYAGPGGRVPVGAVAKLTQRNLATAATNLAATLGRVRSTVYDFGKNANLLRKHIQEALREGRINRGLDKGKEYTIFGSGRLYREGNQVKLKQVRENEPLYVVRNRDGQNRVLGTLHNKPIDLEPGDFVFRGGTPDNKFVGQSFEFRGLPVKGKRVPIGDRVSDAVAFARNISPRDGFTAAGKKIGSAVRAARDLHIGRAVVDQIKKMGFLFRRTPKAPVEGGMTRAEQVKAFFRRTFEAKTEAPLPPLTETERLMQELTSAIKANGLGEPVEAFRLRTAGAKTRPAALYKDGTAISFASKTDEASDLVPSFKRLKESEVSESEVVIKNDGGRRTVVAPKSSEYEVSITRPGRDPIIVQPGKSAPWQEGDTLVVARGDKQTSMEFERSSLYKRTVESMGELRAEVGREGLLKSVWSSNNWWSRGRTRTYAPSLRGKGSNETDTAVARIKLLKPNRKDNIKIDSSTNVKFVKAPEGGTATGEISTTGELFIKRGPGRWVPEKSGKTTLQPGDKFKIGTAGKEHVFTDKGVQRVTLRERIFRRGTLAEAYNRRYRPEDANINILRRASDTAGDAAEGKGNFYSAKFTAETKPIAIVSDGSKDAINLASIPFSREPHALISPKVDGARVTDLHVEARGNVPMYVTNAEGNVLTRIKAQVDLPEGSYLKVGDEVFEVVRDGDNLLLEQVQATKLTQGRMSPSTNGAIEVVEKSFVQANRAKAAAIASNYEVAGSAITYKIKGGSITLGAKHVAVLEKSELSEYAAKQARLSFEPEGIFVEALSDKPVFIIRKTASGKEVAEPLKQGERVKFDPETMAVRLGHKDNDGRSVFRLKANESPKVTPEALTPEVEVPTPVAPTRTALPEGEYTAAPVVPDVASPPVSVVKTPDTRLGLKKEIGAAFKDPELVANPEALKTAIAAAISRVDPALSAQQIRNDLNSAFRSLSIDLRYRASFDGDGNVIIKTFSQSFETGPPFAPKMQPTRSQPRLLFKEAENFVDEYRTNHFQSHDYNAVESIQAVIDRMSEHGNPELIARILNRELKKVEFSDRLSVSVENGQFRITRALVPDENSGEQFLVVQKPRAIENGASDATPVQLRDTSDSPVLTVDVPVAQSTSIAERISAIEITQRLKSYLVHIKPEHIRPVDITTLSVYARRPDAQLFELNNFYVKMLNAEGLPANIKPLIENAQKELSDLMEIRTQQIADLASKKSVQPKLVLEMVRANSDPNYLLPEMATNLVRLIQNNGDNISSANISEIASFLRAVKNMTLGVDVETLSKAFDAKEATYSQLNRLGKIVPSDKTKKDLVTAVSGNNLDNASLEELAKAVRNGHMDDFNSEAILRAIAARRESYQFSDAAEYAFAFANFERLANGLGMKSKGKDIIAELSEIAAVQTQFSPQMVEALTTMTRTVNIASEEVDAILNLVEIIRKNDSFNVPPQSGLEALLGSIDALNRRVVEHRTPRAPFTSVVSIGGAIPPADAVIILGPPK